MNTEILVCVLCRPDALPRDAPRPGRALLEAIENFVGGQPAGVLPRPLPDPIPPVLPSWPRGAGAALPGLCSFS